MSDLAQFTLFFILFLFPSLFVFLYKFNAWSKVRKKGFWYFLYSEYISILIILGIIVTVVGTAILIQRYQAPKYSHSIEYYKRHQDYHTLEKIYKSKVIGNTPDWADVYNHIYYHFKQPYTFVDDENNFLGVRSDSSLARFYHRFLKAKLPEEKQIWYFYKTLQWSLVNRPELAISEFITHDLYDLPYLNYFIGTFEWERPLIAEDHFKKEIDNKGFVEEAYIALSKLYIENQRFDDLERLLNTPEASRYIPLSIQAHWYYIKGDYLHFIGLHYQERLGRVHAIGLLVAFIILIIWFLFFYKLDLFEPEKKYWLILVVLTSALLTNLSLIAYEFFEVNLNFYLNGKPFNDLLFSIFGIGLIEETVKLIPFMFILLLKPKLINEPYDILLYMVMSALAFAFTENLIYFTEGSLHTYTARAIYSSMGHMFFSATIAYGFILANYRYNNWKFVPTILLFFFISITAHGVFDYLLFYDYYVVFVFFFIILTKAFIKYINNSLNNSVFFDYHIKMKSINLRQLLAIGISLIFAVEFIYTASYYSIAKALDEAFSLNNYSSLFVLIFIADHFSHFNLVKGEWGVFNLSFNTYNLHTAEENFVGIKARINIPEKLENINRIEYHSTIEGELINKVQIYYDSIWLKKKKIVEKGWFIMALDESILINGKIVNKLAINFVSNSANLYYRSEDVYWMQIKDESQLADNNIKSNFILLGKAKLDKIES